MKEKPIVLGAEMAAANDAERARLDAGTAAPSPFQNRAYDLERGECDLLRLVPSLLDAEIDALVRSWRALGTAEREKLRGALTLADNYTLLQFARRMAVRALNQPSEQPTELGMIALAMIDEARVDSRDVAWAAGLLSHAVSKGSGSSREIRARAASLATPDIARILGGASGDSVLADWGYRERRTAEGIGLIRSGWAKYEPTIDLVSVADQIGTRILAERYIFEVEVAVDVPSVWFARRRRKTVQRVLDSASGTVAIRADLRPTAGDGASQMFVIWLAELPSPDACVELVMAVGNGIVHPRRHTVGVAAGRLFALLVAGSARVGVAAYESLATLKELAGRTRVVLTEPLP